MAAKNNNNRRPTLVELRTSMLANIPCPPHIYVYTSLTRFLIVIKRNLKLLILFDNFDGLTSPNVITMVKEFRSNGLQVARQTNEERWKETDRGTYTCSCCELS